MSDASTLPLPCLAPSRVRRLYGFVRVRVSRKHWRLYRIRLRSVVSRPLALLLLAIGLPALAAPVGGKVVSGQAQITAGSPLSMLVTQTTPKAAIDWQSFSIGANESVRFVQPSTSSVALNRVLGGDPSQIMGSLTANGHVFLVNPQGVYFGPNAHVDTGALVASTLALSDSDFNAGLYRFQGTSAAEVRNDGHLTAAPGGYVALAGAHVANNGTITADSGSVVLAAGARVALDLEGDRLVSFSVDEAALRASVANAGAIQANGGSVSMQANALGGALSTAVNQSGVIRANSVSEHDGIVSLRAIGGDTVVTGTIDVSGQGAGQKGGSVEVLGDRVGLFDHATISASGAAGGGTVLVGGDLHGEGGVPTAARTVVDPGASIAADALDRGNGGKVVVWSDGDTSFNGRISSRGGAAGGDGGYVETSGKQVLSVLVGDVNASAPRGRSGTWLMDPNDLSIEDHGGTNVNISGTFQTTDDSAILDTTRLGNALTNGTNVIVLTTSSGANTQEGNITVNDITTANLSAGQTATLTLDAQGSIFFAPNAIIRAQAGSTFDRSLNVHMNAGTNPNGSGAGTFDSTIEMDPTAFIEAGLGGTVTAVAKGAVILGGIHSTRGGLSVTSNGGAVVQGATALSLGGALSVAAGAGKIQLGDATNIFGGSVSATSTSTNALILRDSTPMVLAAINAGGNLAIVSGGTITETAPVKAAGASLFRVSAGAAQDILLQTQANDLAGTVTFDRSGTGSLRDLELWNASATASMPVLPAQAALFRNLVLKAPGGTDIVLPAGLHITGNLIIAGNLDPLAGKSITDAGSVTVDGTSALQAAKITLDGPGDKFTGAMTLTGTDAAVHDTVGLTAHLAMAATGTTQLTSTGDVVADGTAGILSVGGDDVTNHAATLGDSHLTTLNLSADGAVVNTGAVAGSATLKAGDGATVTNSGAVAGTLTTQGANTILSNEVGSLAVTAAGTVTQPVGATLTVDSTATIDAGGHAVILANAGNDFRGLVTVSGAGISLRDANDLAMGGVAPATNTSVALVAGGNLSTPATGINAGTAALTLTSGNALTVGALTGGTVTLTGATGISIDGNLAAHDALAMSTSASGADIVQTAGNILSTGLTTATTSAGDIALAGTGNDFGGAVTVHGAAVAVTDRGDLVIAGSASSLVATAVAGDAHSAVATSGNSEVDATGAQGDAFNTAVVHGDLVLQGGLSASNSGAVGGSASLLARGTVTNTGVVQHDAHLVSTNHLRVTNTADVLGALDTEGGATILSGHLGSLVVDARGAVTQPAALVVDGTTHVTAIGQDVLLANAGNDFKGLVYLTGGPAAGAVATTIALHDANVLAIGGIVPGTGQSLDLSAVADLVLPAAAIELGSGDLALASGGRLTTPGDLAAHDIRLSAAGGLDITHDITASGDLSLATSGAAIVQTAGRIDAAGATTLSAGAGDISLTSATNNFHGAVSATGASVSLVDADDLSLSGTMGQLAVTAGGDVREPAEAGLIVRGATVIDAAGHAVLLANGGNDFQGPVSVTAAETTLADVDALVLGTVTTDTLAVTSGGAISQAGPAVVSGTSTFAAAGSAVTLDAAGNRFTGAVSSTGSGAVVIDNGLATVLGAIGTQAAPAASLDVSSPEGDVTQDAAAFVSGNVNVDAGGHAILMNDHGNELATSTTLAAAAAARGGPAAAGGLAVSTFAGGSLDYFDNAGAGVARVNVTGITGDATMTTTGRQIELFGGSFDGTAMHFASTSAGSEGVFLLKDIQDPYLLGAHVLDVTTSPRSQQNLLQFFEATNALMLIDGVPFSALEQLRAVAAASTTASVTDEERRELERAAGFGRLRQGIRLNTITFEEMVAPLSYREFQVTHAPCAKEQAEGMDGKSCQP